MTGDKIYNISEQHGRVSDATAVWEHTACVMCPPTIIEANQTAAVLNRDIIENSLCQ